MGDAGYFRGTSAEQDNRFSDKEKKLMKQMKFADSIAKKVDMSKIKLEVLKPWISNRIMDLLGMEDDVLVEFVSNQLEAENFPDGRRIQINLTGFLNGKNARIFTGELWDLLISAQEQDSGIPISIIEAKKEEIKQRQEEKQKVKETLERTLGHFLPSIKKERSSPPPGYGKDSRDSGGNNHNSSDSFSKNSSRNRDSDRRLDRDRDAEKHGRQYRQRPSRSRSRSPQLQRRDRNRDHSDRRERRGGERDGQRASPTPQQLIDAARERDRQERDRNRLEPPRHRDGENRDRFRRQSPLQSFRQRQSPDQPRGRGRGELNSDEGAHRRIVAAPKLLQKNSVSSSDSSSESEEERIETKKKTKRRAPRSDSSDPSSPKSKKKKKKSKKHKKQKKVKQKEMKRIESSSSEEDTDDDDVEENSKNREELERSLRERALASMKKRQEKAQECSN